LEEGAISVIEQVSQQANQRQANKSTKGNREQQIYQAGYAIEEELAKIQTCMATIQASMETIRAALDSLIS
jgi:hypothetical protein